MTARRPVRRIQGDPDRREERLRALGESAIRARGFAPAETLDQGFELIESGRSLRRAAEDAHAGRGA